MLNRRKGKKKKRERERERERSRKNGESREEYWKVEKVETTKREGIVEGGCHAQIFLVCSCSLSLLSLSLSLSLFLRKFQLFVTPFFPFFPTLLPDANFSQTSIANFSQTSIANLASLVFVRYYSAERKIQGATVFCCSHQNKKKSICHRLPKVRAVAS